MRIRFLAVVFLSIVLLVSGCGKKMQYQAEPGSETVVTQKEEFLNLYRGSTKAMEDIAQRTNQAYSDWNSGIIDRKAFLEKTEAISGELNSMTRRMEQETSFDLKESDKKQVNYDAVTKAYGRASKDISDFYYFLPHLKDNEVKPKYEELMVNKFGSDIKELKSLLGV